MIILRRFLKRLRGPCKYGGKHYWVTTGNSKYIYSQNRLVGFDLKKFRLKYEYCDKYSIRSVCDFCGAEKKYFKWKPKFQKED